MNCLIVDVYGMKNLKNPEYIILYFHGEAIALVLQKYIMAYYQKKKIN